MKFCAQIVQPETLNPLKNPPNPTAETLTLEKSPNPAQTLTLRSKEEAMGLPERRGGRCRRHGNPDGERSLGTWSRAASRAPGPTGPTPHAGDRRI